MTRSSRLLACVLICLAYLAQGLVACSSHQRQAQTVVASTLAVTANAALPALTAAYQADGDRAIDAAATQTEARAALVTVRARWAPVWKAWDAVRLAHAAWVVALEAQNTDDINRTALAMRDAYCGLRAVVPPGVVLAEAAGFGCGP